MGRKAATRWPPRAPMDRAAVRRYRAGMLAHSSASRAASSPARSEPLPVINDRPAPPETRIEVLDGKKIVTMPADPEHATKHIEVAAVVKAHVAKGYTAAVDMLTRTSKTSDFAPDVSVFPSAP